ncbi:phosphoribosylglycinamide formyltransferase [Phorcysia thermohydrogeniphila]|uniref:Phosphoribosylglycinamide formyltransferase n=1 Tax=Phorcysia thermohydrogeniphila TaxID=936138 RepID=A0A4R1G788_9BACT|nr:phosphoribosylglycinamide formyltransferase [Phorcysia thermohydrogeniphila]TCK03917.1 phosphoribosylglycinamide formyltransferase-1 [Phorcysia thermohydrogeniphila]
MKRIAVLASGRGSNFEAIARAVLSGKINAEVAVLIVDRKNIGAIERAEKLGINWVFVDPNGFPSREEYDSRIVAILKYLGVDLVCLAGYKKIVSAPFVDAFPGRIMNIHPTLLPSFPGLKPHEKVLKYGVNVSGATVHFVDKGVDTGPIIVQVAVPVSPDDTPETLSERILRYEHRIYPQAVKWFVDGRIELSGRKVIVKGADYSSLPVVPALEDF